MEIPQVERWLFGAGMSLPFALPYVVFTYDFG